MKVSKTHIYIAVAILVFLIVFAWYYYRKGKKTAEGPQIQYPQGGSSIPAGWSPVPLIEQLYSAMDGGSTLTGTKDTAWQAVLDLPTDEMIIAVYNGFNQKYYGEGDGTLTQWIRDERWYDYTSGVKSALLKKLLQLNLP